MTATRCAEDRVEQLRRAYAGWARMAREEAELPHPAHLAPCQTCTLGALMLDALSISLDLASAVASEARLRAGVPT